MKKRIVMPVFVLMISFGISGLFMAAFVAPSAVQAEQTAVVTLKAEDGKSECPYLQKRATVECPYLQKQAAADKEVCPYSGASKSEVKGKECPYKDKIREMKTTPIKVKHS